MNRRSGNEPGCDVTLGAGIGVVGRVRRDREDDDD